MLKEIRLKNFKCFREETTVPLSTINLLTGINGRGKSTLLQSMLLMKQSVEHNEYTTRLILNGNCVNLGTYEDLKNSESDLGDEVEIGFEYEDDLIIDRNLKIQYSVGLFTEIIRISLKLICDFDKSISSYQDFLERIYQDEDKNNKYIFESNWLVGYDVALASRENETNHNKDKKTDFVINPRVRLKRMLPEITELHRVTHEKNVSHLKKTTNKYDENSVYDYQMISDLDFYNRIHYIAADRLGSQEYYKKINLNDFISVDKKGENLATVLFELKEILVNDKLCSSEIEQDLITQTGEWLSQIFDTKVEIEIKDNFNTLEILFTINGKQHKPTNVGFGYSYILPIIVSGLIAKEGEIVIIENPEAHLHPKAQSELTKFLAKVASCGVQIFIESHSEHILRGLQVSVLKEDIEIDEKDVNILYFHNEEKDSNFTQIPVNADGSIENWPNDFFDQADKDYKILFGF